MPLRSYLWRIYSHYMAPSRMPEYRSLLEVLLENDYETHSIISFWRLLQKNESPLAGKHVILRHDVDLNPEAAEEMWLIEQEYGVKSSFYFRLSTLNFDLMRCIEDSGSEASYHYEELATVIKNRCLKTVDEAVDAIPDAQKMFEQNFSNLKTNLGLPMASVASHGDFANRAIGMTNCRVLSLPSLRKKLTIEVEAYDQALMAPVTDRYSDAMHPHLWTPHNPQIAIARSSPVIYILTHPCNLKRKLSLRVKEDCKRVLEGIKYKVG